MSQSLMVNPMVKVVREWGLAEVIVTGYFTVGGTPVNSLVVTTSGATDDLTIPLIPDNFIAFIDVTAITGSATFTLQAKGPDGNYYDVASIGVTAPTTTYIQSTTPLTPTLRLTWSFPSTATATITLTYQALIR